MDRKVKICVLDYSCNSVDIITTTTNLIEEYGGIESYLSSHCQYNMENIHYMVDFLDILELTHDSFGSEDKENTEYILCERLSDIYITGVLLTCAFDNNVYVSTAPLELTIKGTTVKDLYTKGAAAEKKIGGVDYLFRIYAEEGKLNVTCKRVDGYNFYPISINAEEISIGFDDETEDNHPECDTILIDGDDDKPWCANFYDGFAVEMGNADEDRLRVMVYPTRKMVLASSALKEAIEKCTCRTDYTPFDIALKYGSQLYYLDEIAESY